MLANIRPRNPSSPPPPPSRVRSGGPVAQSEPQLAHEQKSSLSNPLSSPQALPCHERLGAPRFVREIQPCYSISRLLVSSRSCHRSPRRQQQQPTSCSNGFEVTSPRGSTGACALNMLQLTEQPTPQRSRPDCPSSWKSLKSCTTANPFHTTIQARILALP